jgi:hypothetical protein
MGIGLPLPGPANHLFRKQAFRQGQLAHGNLGKTRLQPSFESGESE